MRGDGLGAVFRVARYANCVPAQAFDLVMAALSLDIKPSPEPWQRGSHLRDADFMPPSEHVLATSRRTRRPAFSGRSARGARNLSREQIEAVTTTGDMYNGPVEIDTQAWHRELIFVRDELDHVGRKLQAYGADLEVERLRRKVVAASEKVQKLIAQLK